MASLNCAYVCVCVTNIFPAITYIYTHTLVYRYIITLFQAKDSRVGMAAIVPL